MQPILTAKVGNNSDLFPDVLKIYSKPGDKILDMTWGMGRFWQNVDLSGYDLLRNDIDPARGDVHFDFREMSLPDSSFDIIVLDPPYMFGAGGKDSVMDHEYKNGMYRQNKDEKGIKAIINLYRDGMDEAYRMLKDDGLLMVKCMDLIQGRKQHRIHQQLWHIAVHDFQMVDEDLFVLVTSSSPIMRHNYQLHARKNNSFLWVFRKD
jgi:tRNA G10  N-methylase Trm11